MVDSLEHIAGQQLEFPFLNEVRMQLYYEEQRRHMVAGYEQYKKTTNQPDYPFGRYAMAYIESGSAALFAETARKKHFYDAPL